METKIYPILRTRSAFESEPIEALRHACASLSTIECPAKTALLAQGVLMDSVFLIISGLVKLTHVDFTGKEIIVGIRRCGWMLGATAAILQQPPPTGAITVTACQLLRVPATEIRNFIGGEPIFCRYLHELQAQEAHDHVLNVVEMASHSTEYRLSRLLLELVTSAGPVSSAAEPNFEIPLRQWEIAELLGVTPEHLCRVIRRLEGKGVVLRRRSKLVVADAERLAQSSESKIQVRLETAVPLCRRKG